jgi:hypothetical protein
MNFQKLSGIIASFFLSLIFGMGIITLLMIFFNDIIDEQFIYMGIAIVINGFILAIIYALIFIPLSIYGKSMLRSSLKESYENFFPIVFTPILLITIIIISIYPKLLLWTENWFWVLDIYGLISLGLWLFLNSIMDYNKKTNEIS